MPEKIFASYSDVARHYATTRQNVQQWLDRSGFIAQCEKISGDLPTKNGKRRTLAILIPERILQSAPFAHRHDHE